MTRPALGSCSEMVALLMLEEVLLATFSMMVSCTSFPVAAGAPRVYVPLKSLAGAENALNVSASNIRTEIRRDVRAEIMGSSTGLLKPQNKNDSPHQNVFRDWSPEGTFLLPCQSCCDT